jgi:selenide,water dikinase
VKDLVLVGGGHSHVAVLKRFAMKRRADVRLTLISRNEDTPYSGMLPGLIAGHYARDEAHIDLQRLARYAGARAIFDEAIGLDLADRRIACRSRPAVAYDLLSIDIGSTPNASVPGAEAYAIPVKPIDGFLQRWEQLVARVVARAAPTRVAVVGGGAGGVELLLSAQHRLRALLAESGRRSDAVEFSLLTAAPSILPSHNRRARRMLERILSERRVRIHAGSAVVEVREHTLITASGRIHQADEILWTTEAKAAPWLRASGLAVDDLGFVRVSRALQSISHPAVFAAGDVAAIAGYQLEKSGVYAVRQGKVLGENLERAIDGEPLQDYRPQRQFLSLISTGNRHAVASRGRVFAAQGGWVWRWKDGIDRRFMRQYEDLPEMPERRGGPVAQDRLPDAAGMTTAMAPMRCGGCGAKVGATVLERALARVRQTGRSDVLIGLEAPDDAAVVEPPACKALVQTVDFFRAMVDDAYTFGRIAATHALGDIYAMGGEPATALALVTIPYGPEQKVEDTLTELLSGAVEVLHEAGAALVGGHTSEGAELALGFTVNGAVDRDRVMRKGGLQPGDRLVLTKPIGTGTLFAADMRHRARGRWITGAIASMTTPNREAAACLLRHGVRACTDVTGFGLLGHLVEMLRASGVEAELHLGTVPLLDGAEETVRAGILSTLQPANLRLRHAVADAAGAADTARYSLIFDPQTSGGLLAGVRPDRVEACITDLRAAGYSHAAIVGQVLPRSERPELVTLRSG